MMTSTFPIAGPTHEHDCRTHLILDMLEKSGNKDLANLPLASRYEFIDLQTAKARQGYGLDAPPDILLFCTLALSRGAEFDREPAIASLLLRVKREGASFGKVYWESYGGRGNAKCIRPDEESE